jgi:hypothetical protein
MSSSSIESLETVAERRGASVLLETLSSVGCEYVFGNPGTTELPLMDALLDAPQLKYVWALQEPLNRRCAPSAIKHRSSTRPAARDIHRHE